MNDDGQSDGCVVPEKRANNGTTEVGARGARGGKAPGQGKPEPADPTWTQRQLRLDAAMERVREAARRDKEGKFTALLHHLYDVDRLRRAFLAIDRRAAAGVDRVTWQRYAEDLEANLQDLSHRLARGAYRPEPVRRVYIPKADGRQRPIGVPTLEDKIVQRAMVEVLGAIYEVDFLPFSYGFRPERGQHDALDALSIGIYDERVNYVLDADIRGFFDNLDHEWLIRFIEHRIADRRVVALIQKWLRAGVLEEGQVWSVGRGTPQGGSISPLLANIYLHYAFDLWVRQWGNRQAHGDIVVVRYADDFIVGLQHEEDANALLMQLRERLQKFGLELHPEKTRLIEFGRYAAERRRKRGLGKPETFDFLGFTHVCTTSRKGTFRLGRRTSSKKFRAKLAELKEEARRRARVAPRDLGPWLGAVMRGHTQYYGVPLNYDALARFRDELAKLWQRTLRALSQRNRATWERMRVLMNRWVPRPAIVHGSPLRRLHRHTRGKSPVR